MSDDHEEQIEEESLLGWLFRFLRSDWPPVRQVRANARQDDFDHVGCIFVSDSRLGVFFDVGDDLGQVRYGASDVRHHICEARAIAKVEWLALGYRWLRAIVARCSTRAYCSH